MNFDNLTRDQNRYIYNEISRAIHNTQERLFIHGIDFDLLQMLKAFISFFINQPDIRQDGVLRTVLSMILPQRNQKYYIDGIMNTAYGSNLAGKILLHQGKDEANKQVLMNFQAVYHIYNQEQKKIKSLTEKLFFYGFQEIQLENAKNGIQHQSIKNKKFYIFLKKIKEYQPWRYQSSLVRKQMFDKELLDKECKMLQEYEVKSYRKQVIVALYKQQLDQYDIQQKYNCYQLITYLFTISDQKFIKEFEVKNVKDIDMLVKFIKGYDAYNLNELKMKVSIVKHVECSEIYFEFSNNFKVEDITDDTIINMLDNIKNRLQRFEGSNKSQYVIIRRISDNKIMKCMVTDNNQQEIEQMIQQCNDNQLYDVIIYSQYEYENLENIRMRYLNYRKIGSNIQLTLNHPEDIVSLSTLQVKISNINQCTNLRNLCSEYNTYNRDDIVPLKNLRRIYSHNDKYEQNGNCLLQVLFKYHKPEYVFIYNDKSDSNIVNSLVIQDNIENLRFMFVYSIQGVHDIKLNINQTTPENLRVFDVHTWKDDVHKYGTIQGNEAKVTEIKGKLIHQLKEEENVPNQGGQNN